ncbi:MAG: hypothetical protein ACTSU5_04305 [Promethearchaeota archaeon]
MVDENVKLLSIREIEGLRGIRGPHEKELADIGEDKLPLFREVSREQLPDLVGVIGGEVVDIGMGEEWCIAKEYYPGVVVYIAYQDYGDEFGTGSEDELQFFFSGDRVSWIPGEDLASIVEVQTIRMENHLKGVRPEITYDGVPSQLLLKAIVERSEPFSMVPRTDFRELAEFLGARYFEIDAPMVRKTLFPNFRIRVEFGEGGQLEYAVEGRAVPDFPKYDAERLLIMTINHALRWVKLKLGREVPRICDFMFSGSYKQAHPGEFQ